MKHAVLLALVVVAAACGNLVGPSSPSSSIVGTYVFSSIRGTHLPFGQAFDGDSLVYDGGELVIGTGFTLTMKVSIFKAGRETIADPVYSGGYALSGDTLTLYWNPDGHATTGAVSESGITLYDDVRGSGTDTVYFRRYRPALSAVMGEGGCRTRLKPLLGAGCR